jgi:hypothetical protein
MIGVHRKVAVLGTSNSIMKAGWFPLAKADQQRHCLQYQNFSIGGCTSVLAAHAVYRFRLIRDYDLIAVDFCVNDMMAMQANHITMNHVLAYHASFIRDLILHDGLHKVLILLFPVRDTCGTPAQRVQFDLLIALFDIYGICYIDFDVVVQDWATSHGRPLSDAFGDPYHFSPAIVQHVTDTISKALGAQSLIAPTIDEKAAVTPEISLSCLAMTPSVTPQHIKTSQMGFPVQTLPEGMQFKLVGAAYLVAVFHWHHDNSSALVFHSDKTPRRFILRRAWHNMFRCDALATAIEVMSGLNVTVTNDTSVLREQHFGIKNSIYDTKGATADIVDFIGCNVDPTLYGQRLARRLTSLPNMPNDQPVLPVNTAPQDMRSRIKSRFFSRQ